MSSLTSIFSRVKPGGTIAGTDAASTFSGNDVASTFTGNDTSSAFASLEIASTFGESGIDFNATLLLYGIITEDGINYIGSEHSRYIIQE